MIDVQEAIAIVLLPLALYATAAGVALLFALIVASLVLSIFE